MTATRLPTGFGSLDQPASWPPPRARPRPELLEAPLDTLPGVGPTIRRRLQKLGLETVGDLLSHRPFRYEQPRPSAGGSPISSATRRSRSRATVRSASLRRPRRGLTILEAVVSDGTRLDQGVVVQPGLARGAAPARHLRAPARPARAATGSRSRATTSARRRTRPPTSRPSIRRARRSRRRSCASWSRRRCRSRATLPDPLPAALKAQEGLPFRADALHALHRPRSLAEAEAGRRRLAFDELLVLQVGLAQRAARARGDDRARARRAGRADRALPRGAPVHAHRAPGAGDRGDRRRPRARRCRCSGCCRATSAPARPSSRSTRSCARWSAAARAR